MITRSTKLGHTNDAQIWHTVMVTHYNKFLRLWRSDTSCFVLDPYIIIQCHIYHNGINFMGLKFSWGSTFHGVQILMQLADYITKESVNYEVDGQTWTVQQMNKCCIVQLWDGTKCWLIVYLERIQNILMDEESIGW